MNHLLRDLAPISNNAWEEIESEAKRVLKLNLAARRFVDFSGPHGWKFASISRGRTVPLGKPDEAGAQARLRDVQPLLEVDIPFTLDRAELDAIDRGAPDPDLEPVVKAAQKAAQLEDQIIFHGLDAAKCSGIFGESASQGLTLSDDYTAYPKVVAQAIARLKAAGVNGPYAIALGPQCYSGLTQTTQHGYPIIKHVERELDGPIIWAPSMRGALVISMRSGDFALTVGQDFSIGYSSHTADQVQLYLQESFAFTVLTPEAAVPLTYGKEGNE